MKPMKQTASALGLGLGAQNSIGGWLDSFFPAPLLSPAAQLVDACLKVAPDCAQQGWARLSPEQCQRLAGLLDTTGDQGQAAIAARLADSQRSALVCLLQNDQAPDSVPAAYLMLHLLSHRLVRPSELVLDGLFAVLPNVAWTNNGPVDLNELAERQFQARLRGEALIVDSVDKFPQMTNYVVPPGVRIANSARVRLGAYIGQGTTIMHEGFVNFNAGTEGPGMIEGRISAGVMVGSGSDLGGGCSTMGTLSGGGNEVISVGRNCLIGANAGIGIPLGDRCTVEAGLYVTAGTRVSLLDQSGGIVNTIKARDLASQPDLLFRRNSQSGAVECLSNRSAIELNEALHAHN